MSEPAKAVSSEHVLLETRQGGIVSLVLNRPEKLNALNNELATALVDVFTKLGNDPSVHVVILSGAGRGFCAGGDLGLIGKGRESSKTEELEPLLRSGMQAVLKMRTMPQPVIAAVHGAAAGAGLNIALAADIRVASDSATFGENFTRVGLYPDYGGTFFLPQLVGPAKAAEMFYTGEMIDAATALRLGIVNHVVPLEQLEVCRAYPGGENCCQVPRFPFAPSNARFSGRRKKIWRMRWSRKCGNKFNATFLKIAAREYALLWKSVAPNFKGNKFFWRRASWTIYKFRQQKRKRIWRAATKCCWWTCASRGKRNCAALKAPC